MPPKLKNRSDAFSSSNLLRLSLGLFACGLAFWEFPRFFPMHPLSSLVLEAAACAGVLVGATGLVPLGFLVALSLARQKQRPPRP